MKQLANGEWSCPVEGCPTSLQRSLDGTARDGVIAHLQIVHYPHLERAVVMAKHFDYLGAAYTS